MIKQYCTIPTNEMPTDKTLKNLILLEKLKTTSFLRRLRCFNSNKTQTFRRLN